MLDKLNLSEDEIAISLKLFF